jgi:hypothetical protein
MNTGKPHTGLCGAKRTGPVGVETAAQPLTIKAKEVAIMAKRKYPTMAPTELVGHTITASYHSSSVRCRPIATSKYGVMEACFSGPLEEKSFAHLRAGMIAATDEAPALLIRLNKVLMMFSGPPAITDGTYPKNRYQVAAVVVRNDQTLFWFEYAERMANLGIVYRIFQESQEAKACQWIEKDAPFLMQWPVRSK